MEAEVIKQRNAFEYVVKRIPLIYFADKRPVAQGCSVIYDFCTVDNLQLVKYDIKGVVVEYVIIVFIFFKM